MHDLDAVIVGAGPAGISAALWAHSLHLRYAVLDAGATPGGQLHRVYNEVADYLGVPMAATGAALAERFVGHLEAVGATVRSAATITRVDAAGGVVETADGPVTASYVVLATGIRRRALGVPGEADVVGRGHSPAASRFAGDFRGERVLVIGGGDAAFEEALVLAEVCDHVTLAHRGDRVRARPDFRARVAAEPRVEVLAATELVRIEGDARVTGATLRGPKGERSIPVAGVFVCAGVVPNSELVAGQVRLDEQGYVVVDARQRTSAGRLYAAGDVCAGSSWTIAAAAGQGAAAIKDIQRRITGWAD